MHTKSNLVHLLSLESESFSRNLSKKLFSDSLSNIVLRSVPTKEGENFSFESEELSGVILRNLEVTLESLFSGELEGGRSKIKEYLIGDQIGNEGIDFGTSLASVCGKYAQAETTLRRRMAEISIESESFKVEKDETPREAISRAFGNVSLESENNLQGFNYELEDLMSYESEAIINEIKQDVVNSIEETTRKNEIVQAAVEELKEVKANAATVATTDEVSESSEEPVAPVEGEPLPEVEPEVTAESFVDLETVDDIMKRIVPSSVLSVESAAEKFDKRAAQSDITVLIMNKPNAGQEINDRFNSLNRIISQEGDANLTIVFDKYSEAVKALAGTSNVIQNEVVNNLGITHDTISESDSITVVTAEKLIASLTDLQKKGNTKFFADMINKGVMAVNSVDMALESAVNLAVMTECLNKLDLKKEGVELYDTAVDNMRRSYENLNEFVFTDKTPGLMNKTSALEVISRKCDVSKLFNVDAIKSDFGRVISHLNPQEIKTPGQVLDQVVGRVRDEFADITANEISLVTDLVSGKNISVFEDSLYEKFIVSISKKKISLEDGNITPELKQVVERRARLYTTHAASLKHIGITSDKDESFLRLHLN